MSNDSTQKKTEDHSWATIVRTTGLISLRIQYADTFPYRLKNKSVKTVDSPIMQHNHTASFACPFHLFCTPHNFSTIPYTIAVHTRTLFNNTVWLGAIVRFRWLGVWIIEKLYHTLTNPNSTLTWSYLLLLYFTMSSSSLSSPSSTNASKSDSPSHSRIAYHFWLEKHLPASLYSSSGRHASGVSSSKVFLYYSQPKSMK